MDLQLGGKNVLITGGGQGVGRELGEAFVSEGANVAFSYNSSSVGAEKAAAAANEAGGRAVAVQADITSQADVDRMVSEVVEAQLGAQRSCSDRETLLASLRHQLLYTSYGLAEP